MNNMHTKAKHSFPGEIALLLGVTFNTFALTLIIKSGLGITVTSGVPYVLWQIWPGISQGMWNTLVQCGWMLVLTLTLHRFRPGYLLSFALAFCFGRLMDFWGWALASLPTALPFRFLWFILGYCIMSTGIALLMRCRLPILPFDTVPREFVAVKGWSVRTARTRFDLFNLTLVILLGLIFLGRLEAVGVGTVFCALFLGTGAGFVAGILDRSLRIEPKIAFLAKLV